MYFHRLLAVVGLCLMVVGIAGAQTVSRQAVLTWSAPTACAGGGALSQCPILGYSVQERINNVWTEVGTTTSSVLTYTHRNIAVGPHTYRVLATSAAGPSEPSNEITKGDVPGTPSNVVVTITVTVTP